MSFDIYVLWLTHTLPLVASNMTKMFALERVWTMHVFEHKMLLDTEAHWSTQMIATLKMCFIDASTVLSRKAACGWNIRFCRPCYSSSSNVRSPWCSLCEINLYLANFFFFLSVFRRSRYVSPSFCLSFTSIHLSQFQRVQLWWHFPSSS